MLTVFSQQDYQGRREYLQMTLYGDNIIYFLVQVQLGEIRHPPKFRCRVLPDFLATGNTLQKFTECWTICLSAPLQYLTVSQPLRSTTFLTHLKLFKN